MRDAVAGLVALALLLVAASLATTLTYYRRRRQQRRARELARGRTLVAEIPGDDDLVLFSEDEGAFHYGDRAIDKDQITAVRVLINGVPIAAFTSSRAAAHPQTTAFEDRPEGIARDRWDVAIETVDGPVLVVCGAIRERVSQELARAVFDVVKRDLELREVRSLEAEG
jgi:hypothetical protein